ncbi:YceI family protein [Olivibacter ginsenosidimutans]|uniref:YceI family protein n=1 Tax=Olivibacter ginsenosidimutans TaxID=1176537 RepID=A0ABP9BW92_9SPHI
MVNWTIDPQHSAIHFKVKHMLISTVTGMFTKFDGTVDSIDGHHFEDASIRLSISTASVYTNEAYRDDHLRSTAFFDVDQFPFITFQSSSFTSQGKRNFILKGQLTIKAISQPIELQVKFGGIAKHEGQEKAGFKVSGNLNRKDFGLRYNPLMEAGGMVVSEIVEIKANVELTKQQ